MSTFMEAVEGALGLPLLVYVIPEQFGVLFGDGDLPARRLWVRALFSKPEVEGGEMAVWQFHSRGWVSGVKGPVDLNAVPPRTWVGWEEVNAAGVR